MKTKQNLMEENKIKAKQFWLSKYLTHQDTPSTSLRQIQ